ncbi:hypothetical protein BESB_024140 [Besnoitia besnoiti]|uniref:Hyaluronan/mRNA-binding protein domain-containing protein n=1 Tax=Besnoitia besnoiti TaxID=94643 RepID=A0A2A9M958_BESBE|nr:hypothetical protein BESB_024140 [Besnoitia besnoiti]PFH31922.1 hypothetical protein BESB_024140 [Besnoitia besnoiti]
MAPQRKYYTVGVSNKFSAFADNASEGGDSSGEEDVILSAPPAPTAEKENTGGRTLTGNAGKKSGNEGVSAHHASERRPRTTTGARNERFPRDENGPPRGRGGRFPRGGRPAYLGGRQGAEGEVSEETGEGQQGVVEDGYGGYSRRGNFRGGRGRGGRGGRGVHDRHTAASMGGRDPKKGGGGAHNWGDDERVAAEGGQEQKREEEKEKRVDGEEVEEGEKKEGEGEVAEAEEEKKGEEVLDFEAYKKMLEGKRQNLPNFITKSNKKITTDQELEAEGYTLHVKEGREEEEEETASEEEGEEPKKKTMNVFEYIHNGGGRVNLFPSRRRGRGGPAGAQGGRGEGYRGGRGGRGGFGKSRDAPDIQDERAFPSLGGR